MAVLVAADPDVRPGRRNCQLADSAEDCRGGEPPAALVEVDEPASAPAPAESRLEPGNVPQARQSSSASALAGCGPPALAARRLLLCRRAALARAASRRALPATARRA